MPKERYKTLTFRVETRKLIDKANEIIADYTAQGYLLTLRQLYYQLVARDIIENSQRSYSRLGDMISNARLAGLIDWSAIEDRTRNVQSMSHWQTPAEIVQAAADSFRLDKWIDQKNLVEVWVEKEALSGVIAPICQKLDVSYLACRGYMSQSEMWAAGRRFRSSGRIPVVIHLGDHDPSGIDMSRDIYARLEMFMGGPIEVKRIALNMDQVEQYNPPPNPAKMTDSRFQTYIEDFGSSSWELDALDPKTLTGLIKEAVLSYREESKWYSQVAQEHGYRERLQEIANEHNWNE